ncbi:YbjN domain-containing protein [Corynebacterium vitaeruminis]|uniref:YbjN domain-containing protein n=1 Tax=Corynebacterium vitaeruminis DSM 20294 TaxID=1224164 RepID=W5Y3E8_9CORY|nr:YbjN domain-containing protein [Corynebacterium vitaeruminis]AHI23786.1 hypothetical protein B843_12050 [Corynebacterium vitaeruminis DSM 20294]
MTTPITMARVAEILTRGNFTFSQTEAGGVVVPYSDFSLYLTVSDLLFMSTSRWRYEIPASRRAELADFVAERNSHLIAPAFTFQDTGSGYVLTLKSDHPIAGGLSTPQLVALLDTQIQLHAAAAGMLAARFPELVESHANGGKP